MRTFDLYGTSSLTAVELRDKLTALLEIGFQERESSYRGGVYYRAGELDGEHFVILANTDDDPDELPEPDFASSPLLLEVNATLRPDSVRELLGDIPQLELLRSTAV